MGTGSTLRERQQQRTRRDVVRAMLELISADGVDGITIDRIASEAGMSRGTLYAHYPDGFDQIVRTAYDQLGSDLLASAEAAAAGLDDWIDRLVAYATAMVRLAEDPQLGFFYNITGPGRVGLSARPGTGSGGYRTVFERELGAAQAAGLLASDVDVAATAGLFVGMTRQAGIDVARDPSTGERFLAAFRGILSALARS